VIYKKALHSVQIIQYEEAANMLYVSEIQTKAPETFKTDLQKQVYETLDIAGDTV
jgi:hypothetical protein